MSTRTSKLGFGSRNEAQSARPEHPTTTANSSYLTAVTDMTDKLNEWESMYGELLEQLAAAHEAGDIDKASRIEAAMKHTEFLFTATRTRIDVLHMSHSVWPVVYAERADAQARQLTMATWVLAAATTGLVLATIVLVLVTTWSS